jgi:hypothetical protein
LKGHLKQNWDREELAMHGTLSEANLNARHEDRAPAQFRHSPQGFQIWMGASLIDARTLPVALLLISLARPIDVSQEAYFEGEWSERTQRYQRTHIRKHCRFRVFRAKDESALT